MSTMARKLMCISSLIFCLSCLLINSEAYPNKQNKNEMNNDLDEWLQNVEMLSDLTTRKRRGSNVSFWQWRNEMCRGDSANHLPMFLRLKCLISPFYKSLEKKQMAY
ncbi:hypothetical protein SNEBB_002756 [Seison nebaliae]|nr:hypothetical protein SNEBB_002756 [Seison nebaliae]